MCLRKRERRKARVLEEKKDCCVNPSIVQYLTRRKREKG